MIIVFLYHCLLSRQGTHAYMVSNAGARKLLALCSRATFHVDLDVSNLLSILSGEMLKTNFILHFYTGIPTSQPAAVYVRPDDGLPDL